MEELIPLVGNVAHPWLTKLFICVGFGFFLVAFVISGIDLIEKGKSAAGVRLLLLSGVVAALIHVFVARRELGGHDT